MAWLAAKVDLRKVVQCKISWLQLVIRFYVKVAFLLFFRKSYFLRNPHRVIFTFFQLNLVFNSESLLNL